jgi:hypothetical protein
VPRLYRFLEAHPEIDTRISASAQLANFDTDGVDIAIRYVVGALPRSEFHVQKLIDDSVLPLCSPRLRDGAIPLRTPQDLARHTLIHVETPAPFPRPPGWADWLRIAGREFRDADASGMSAFGSAIAGLRRTGHARVCFGSMGKVPVFGSSCALDLSDETKILKVRFWRKAVRPDVRRSHGRWVVAKETQWRDCAS